MNLKTLRKATPQEVEELAKKEWSNSESMQKYIKSNYSFYVTSDNHFLEVQKFNKLSITKTLYYDDETDAPDANINNFIRYNNNNDNYAELLQNEIKHLCEFWFCPNNSTTVYLNYDRYNEKPQKAIRRATTEELSDILAIYQERKINYIKRLKTYYKRYNKHIHASGYWVNR